MAEMARGRDRVQMQHTNTRGCNQWELGLCPSSDHVHFELWALGPFPNWRASDTLRNYL